MHNTNGQQKKAINAIGAIADAHRLNLSSDGRSVTPKWVEKHLPSARKGAAKRLDGVGRTT